MDQIHEPHGADSGRQPYRTPELTDLGSVAELTQGAVGVAALDAGIYS
jgi:hypothetical protein